jgi:hypothetical protein
MDFKPNEYVTLEPYERDHAVVVGTYRPSKDGKEASSSTKKAAAAAKSDDSD